MPDNKQIAQNIRHSANSANWISPPWIANAAREVMDGVIHLDPASCAQANDISVGALSYFDKHVNGLQTPWSHDLPDPQTLTNVYINPPGGWENIPIPQTTKRNGIFVISNIQQTTQVSRVKLWWQRLLTQQIESYFAQALWLSFSIETMQTTQLECETSVLDFPTCVFRNRVAYIDPETGEPVSGMTHSSAITYIKGRVDRTDRFLEVFAPLGKIVTTFYQLALDNSTRRALQFR
jgi:hypothetical protein